MVRAECDFVVIGSSALVLHGWEVSPGDLDVMTPPGEVDRIAAAIGAHTVGRRLKDGEADRIECLTERGPVDLYLAVSGGLSYDSVRDHALHVLLAETGLSVSVGGVESIRDMRSAVGRDALPSGAIAPAKKAEVPHVIAIDGPAGAGKSTVARAVAKRLGFTYLNTGAMYRCVTLAVLERHADPDDPAEIEAIAREIEIDFHDEAVWLDGRDVSEAIRAEDVTRITPHLASFREVRQVMVARQREMFSMGGHIAEGRDTGTVVAPDAPLKLYLTASLDERAKRRSLETGERESQVARALADRDRLDSERELSALRVAEDAVVVDTTGRQIEDVTDEVEALARERGVV
jgi:CMP/dCMP kinase